MRKLGDQWIEVINGQEHMVKAVKPVELCQGCCFNCNQGGCCWKGFDDCQMGSFFIIKDLGILNEDGLLPCPFCGEYPKIIYPTEYMPVVSIVHPGGEHRILLEFFRNKQEAIDAWNRRT